MKLKVNKKYFQLGFTVFITVIALMVAYSLFFKLDSIKSVIGSLNIILEPIYLGFILAYLICPLLNLLENKVLYPLFNSISFLKSDSNKKKHIRMISVLLSLISVLLLIYIFFATLIPQIYNSIQNIIKNYNVYTDNLINWGEELMENNPTLNEIVSQIILNYSTEADDFLNENVLPSIKQFLLPNINDLLINLSSSIIKVFKILYNIVIGLIISIYVLNSKEKFISGSTKFCYAVFENRTANYIIKSVRFIHKTFIGFLSGKILDSAIIGVICYICSLFLGLPYALLISVIVGVTNIIPFFGPYFGAVPSAIIILMVDPIKALYFIIMVLILQQFDGNYLGPKILSGSTGLSSFWIIFSITLFGGLFGLLGMVVGVPITAVIFTGINKVTNKRLKDKNLPIENDQYYDVGRVEEDGTITKYVYVKPTKAPKKETKTYKLFKKIYLSIINLISILIKKIKK